MSSLENGLKVAVLTQSANFFFLTPKSYWIPKSYDEHSRQVKYESPPPPPPPGLKARQRHGGKGSWVDSARLDSSLWSNFFID